MSLNLITLIIGFVLAVLWTIVCILAREKWSIKLFFKILLGCIVSAVIALAIGFIIYLFSEIGWWTLLVIAIVVGIFTPKVYHVKIDK